MLSLQDDASHSELTVTAACAGQRSKIEHLTPFSSQSCSANKKCGMQASQTQRCRELLQWTQKVLPRCATRRDTVSSSRQSSPCLSVGDCRSLCCSIPLMFAFHPSCMCERHVCVRDASADRAISASCSDVPLSRSPLATLPCRTSLLRPSKPSSLSTLHAHPLTASQFSRSDIASQEAAAPSADGTLAGVAQLSRSRRRLAQADPAHSAEHKSADTSARPSLPPTARIEQSATLSCCRLSRRRLARSSPSALCSTTEGRS
jgi:hypothetical protein